MPTAPRTPVPPAPAMLTHATQTALTFVALAAPSLAGSPWDFLAGAVLTSAVLRCPGCWMGSYAGPNAPRTAGCRTLGQRRFCHSRHARRALLASLAPIVMRQSRVAERARQGGGADSRPGRLLWTLTQLLQSALVVSRYIARPCRPPCRPSAVSRRASQYTHSPRPRCGFSVLRSTRAGRVRRANTQDRRSLRIGDDERPVGQLRERRHLLIGPGHPGRESSDGRFPKTET